MEVGAETFAVGSVRQSRLAILIDADNAQATLIQELLEEVARYGTATVKRAYGDWTTSNLKSWKDELHRHAIRPMQQFRYTNGKNSTDSALIIDAMDLLHSTMSTASAWFPPTATSPVSLRASAKRD